MRTRFGPDDEQAFRAAADELVDRFERSPAGRDRGWIAGPLLDFKWSHLDGDLATWSEADLEELLLGLFPAKVLMAPEDLDEVIPTCAAFLEYLGSEGVLTGGERAGQRAADHARTLGPAFLAAATDRRRWGPGKRLWDAAAYDGVEPGDIEAFQAWMATFNDRPQAEREAILGPLPDAPPPEPLPPVALAPEHELVAAAEQSMWPVRMAAFVEFVGSGRKLTDTNNLKLADGEALVELLATGDRFEEEIGGKVYRTRSSAHLSGLDLTLALARAAGYLVVERGWLVAGPLADEPATDPLATVYRIWLTLLHDVGPTQHHYRQEHYNFGWYGEVLDSWLLPLLVGLYRKGAPESIDDIAEDAWVGLEERFDLDDVEQHILEVHRDSVEWSLRRALRRFEELGIVAVAGVEREASTVHGLDDEFGGTVELTDLGRYAVNRYASERTDAPVVGRLRDEPAAAMLRAAADLGDEAAVDEIFEWVSHQGPASADLLVDALADLDETARGLGLRALIGIGEPAASAVDRLAGHPTLSPLATLWRYHVRGSFPAETDSRGDAERFVRLIAAAVEMQGAEAAVAWAEPAAGAAGIAAMLDAAWRVDLPATALVLAAIGEHHPDKAVAKAARKALFKHRTSHGG